MKRVLPLLAGAALLAATLGDHAAAQQPPRAIRRTIPITNMIRQAFEAGTRDSTGRPGPKYWQTTTEYTIRASLDPTTSVVTGTETIVLHNNSPDPMRSIGFRLDQNAFAPGVPRNGTVSATTDGMNVTALSIDGQIVDLTTPAARGEGRFRRPSGPQTEPMAFGFNVTNARVQLSNPIPAHSSATLEIEWHFQVPESGMRMGRLADTLYQLAQWYPRVAVYDDYKGWDTEQYLGNAEFYNNFGHFDVTYDVPAGWLVGSTGVLQNPEEVLTQDERDRLANALDSDDQIHIVDPGTMGPGKSTAAGTRLQWHFVADSVADVAWATSKNYVWDATRADIPGKGYIPVYIFYLPGHEGAPQHFDQVGERVRHALQFYSQLWMPYAFPRMTVADGPQLGMEYPMFIMSGLGAADHETGHEWWPMMVGVNETWWGFMDEGFNQYMNILSDDDRNGRAPTAGLDGPGQAYGRTSGDEHEPPLIWDENYAGPMYSFAAYGKAPMMLSMLGAIVGDSAVWRAHSAYAHAWRFKHPTPWDYVFFMSNALNRDLGWFWYYWIWTTESVDGSIQDVRAQGTHTLVTVRQDGEMPSPVVLRVEFAPGGPAIKPMKNSVMTDSATAEVTYPVDVWFGGSRTFGADLEFGGRQIAKITLDPHKRFPDRNPRDNVWPKPKPVHLTAALLDGYVGTYQLRGMGALTVTREDTTLWLQAGGQNRVQLVPTSETEFYLAEADVTVTFKRDPTGNTTAMVITQMGQEMEAPKAKP
jgi:Domain of unknown function (DUF3471)